MKRKSILIGGIIVLAVLIVIITKFRTSDTPEAQTLPDVSSVINQGKDYFSGTGWASHPNADSALIKAIESSQQGANIEPEVTFLMYSSTFVTDSVLNTIKTRYPDRKFFGWSIVYSLNNFPDGSSKHDYTTVTAMSMKYPYLKTGISSGVLEDKDNLRSVVRSAIEEAYKNAEAELYVDDPDKIIIISDTESNEIFSLVTEYFDNRIPIFGGWVQGDKIANFKKEPYGNNFIVALLFSEKNIAWDFRGGFTRSKHFGQVTKYDNGSIVEINDQWSNDVYSGWCGQSISSLDTAHWSFLRYSTLHPIYLKKRVSGIDYYQFMHPILDDDKNLNIQKHFNVKEGDTIYYAEGNYNLLINHLSRQPEYAVINVPETKPSSALIFCCASYPESIPKEQHKLIAQSLKMTLNNNPWLLTFTNGEHGYVSGLGNIYGNLMTGILIFPEP